jgi:hypothetical protein
MNNNFKRGDQLFINKKWYMDINDVNDEKKQLDVRIKYYESNDKKIYNYKIITLSMDLFTNIIVSNFIINATINPIELKKRIGSLINRLIIEYDMNQLLENLNIKDVLEDGMGAVSSPGLSGTPGLPGTAGSGDVSNSILPANTFGLEMDREPNKRIRKKLKTKAGKVLIKQPVILLTKENITNDELTENDYKNTLYMFLDYPTDNDIDIKIINSINKLRPTFLEISSQRIKEYFKKLYIVNKSLIKTKSSDWFQNNLLILGEITDNEEI